MVEYIKDNINPVIINGMVDKSWWMANSRGNFSVKSAFEMIKRRKEKQEWRNSIWLRDFPFKICFFIWRYIRGKNTNI